MVKITGATVVLRSGTPINGDCYGNNAAIICPKCNEHPVLISTGPVGSKGNDKSNPSTCYCGASIWLDPPANALSQPLNTITIDYK